ncbi:DNA-binding protein [Variovorax paradoxus]|uniref:DNA-binding protein n=1 Tax=Variovorax paradoxus TaxID=34073 RepID=UPI0021AC3548|nr:DNA-binding protein [Variovorax paradoxus]UVH55097.1 DNA-binding protein [Variovorax paradoxus]
MEPQPFLLDNELLVLDTSIVINLNATGCAEKILRALPHRVTVVDVVVGELEYGRSKGRGDAAMLADLAKADAVTIASLGEFALQHFESLVVGASAETLDDGEAATIAYAIDAKARAVIDERKATRLCSNRFPNVTLKSTIDLLSHQAVQESLGLPHLADALHKALLSARMRVPPHHMNWVVNLIGNERTAACRCLPEIVRQAARNA